MWLIIIILGRAFAQFSKVTSPVCCSRDAVAVAFVCLLLSDSFGQSVQKK